MRGAVGAATLGVHLSTPEDAMPAKSPYRPSCLVT